MMLSKTYILENITDLCSYNGQDRCEFRLTEVKSSMRFWWRALNYYEDIGKMKNDEDKIFGDSDKLKSPIIFRLSNDVNEFMYRISNKQWHIVGKNKKVGELRINCFKPCIQIGIQLSVQKRKINKETYTDKDLDYYNNLLKISLVLGGVGKRSRRGCGVFHLVEDEHQILSPEVIYMNVQRYMENLNVARYYDFNINEHNQYLTIMRNGNCEGADYPYIEEINLSRSAIQADEFYQRIKQAIDNCKNKEIFYKTGDGHRLACPIYVTCYGNSCNSLYPIIVKLHNTSHCNDENYYSVFKEAIL